MLSGSLKGETHRVQGEMRGWLALEAFESEVPTMLLCWKGGCFLFHFSERTLKAAAFKRQAGHGTFEHHQGPGPAQAQTRGAAYSFSSVRMDKSWFMWSEAVSSQQTRKQVEFLTRVGGWSAAVRM